MGNTLVYIVYYTDRDSFEKMLQGIFSTKHKALNYIKDHWFENQEDMDNAMYEENKWKYRGDVCLLEKELDKPR